MAADQESVVLVGGAFDGAIIVASGPVLRLPVDRNYDKTYVAIYVKGKDGDRDTLTRYHYLKTERIDAVAE